MATATPDSSKLQSLSISIRKLCRAVNIESGSFEQIYLDQVRPDFSTKVGRTRLVQVDLSIYRFAKSRGRSTPMPEMSEILIEEFVQSLRRQKFGGQILRKSPNDIRCIVRLIDPTKCRRIASRCGKGGQGRKKLIEQPASPGTVRHFFDTVYRPRRLLGKSPNTVRLYHVSIRNFSRFLIWQAHRRDPAGTNIARESFTPKLTDLNDDLLAGLMAWELDRGLSPHTANKERAQLMSIARYAFRKRWLDVEPEVRMVTAPNIAPTAWTMDELTRLFSAIDQLRETIAGCEARLWWKALLLTCYYTGERIFALMSVKAEHLDLSTATLLSPAQFRKGNRSDKIFCLPSIVIESLKSLGTPASGGLLFPWTLSRCMIYKRLKEIHRAAGLPNDRRSMFHRMRRTAATWYKFKGGDPTQLLDHADPKTTAKYIDLRICKTKSPAELMDDPTAAVKAGDE